MKLQVRAVTHDSRVRVVQQLTARHTTPGRKNWKGVNHARRGVGRRGVDETYLFVPSDPPSVTDLSRSTIVTDEASILAEHLD